MAKFVIGMENKRMDIISVRFAHVLKDFTMFVLKHHLLLKETKNRWKVKTKPKRKVDAQKVTSK